MEAFTDRWQLTIHPAQDSAKHDAHHMGKPAAYL